MIDIDFVNRQPIILDITTLPLGLHQDLQQRISNNQKLEQQLKTKAQKHEDDTFKPLEEIIQNKNAWTVDEIAEIVQYTALKNALGTIKLQDQITDEQGNKTDVTWYKDAAGTPKEYIQSHLAIYNGETIDLSVQIETLAHGNDLTIEYDTSLFRLSTTTIPKKGGNKRINNHLQLTCLQEFSTEQFLKVKYKDRTLGQLNIIPNDRPHRFRKDVLFVKVKTNLTGKGKAKKGNSTGEDIILRRYLKQAFIRLDLAPTIELDLRTDATFNAGFVGFDNENRSHINTLAGLHAYLTSKIPNPNQYANHLKIYFFNEKCMETYADGTKLIINGAAESIPSNEVVMFSTHNSETVPHEALHSLGLSHSFSNGSTYTFKELETLNIMDYSHQAGKTRVHLWKFQWNLAQAQSSAE